MRFILDENLPPALAKGLDHFIRCKSEHLRVFHLNDSNSPNYFPRATADTDWISEIAKDNSAKIAVLTIDKFRGGGEWQAFQGSEVIVFRLVKSWMDIPMWDQAKKLINHWDNIYKFADKAAGEAFFSVPIKGKITPLKEGKKKRKAA